MSGSFFEIFEKYPFQRPKYPYLFLGGGFWSTSACILIIFIIFLQPFTTKCREQTILMAHYSPFEGSEGPAYTVFKNFNDEKELSDLYV